MQITQAVFGVFHHFELARELNRRGHLEKIYSTWPWARLKREGLPHDKVETFPWVHTPEYLLNRARLNPPWLIEQLGYANAVTFDYWLRRRLPVCDALIAISGAGLYTGRRLQSQGGKFICDRGSSHHCYQAALLDEEYARWDLQPPPVDPRDTYRETAIYAESDAIVVPSSFARRSFIEMGLPPEKVHTIPYGVRLDRFRPATPPPNDRFEVLFVGQVSLRKGVPYLLQAFARLRHPNKRLRIVGSVPRDLASLLPRLPKDNVEFLGVLAQHRLAELMSTSHLLVLPSIEEGLALVQGQAMACGCPVLSSTNTGGEDLFTDGVEGFIVPVRDVDALAGRMQQLADDPALQQRMSAAALARMQHLGGWREYGDRWEALLHQLTGKP